MRLERERHEAAFPAPQPIQEWLKGLSVEGQTRFMITQKSKAGPLLDQRHFDNLSRLLDGAIAAGMTVVVVDLPLHSDHRRHFPALAEYQARLGEVVASHTGHDRVHLIDLTEALPDEEFKDFVHAKPECVETWVDLLVHHLKSIPPDPSPRRLN